LSFVFSGSAFPAGGVEVELSVTIEIEGGTKPACVAAVVYRYIGA
jgi:hypothetical protein